MPDIPGKCGEFMQKLITRCWEKDPVLRPTFDEILRECREANFEISPEALGPVISDAVKNVLAWERQARGQGGA